MISTNPSLRPPVIPGEALRSYYDRAKLLNLAFSGPGRLGESRVRWRNPDWSLPAGLEEFAQGWGASIKLPSGRYWVARHTLAPYFQSTLPPARRERLVRCMLQPVPGPRRPLLSITLTEWFSKVPVLCHVCDVEAEARHGFSCVQRHWLLPFLTRCHIHGEPLAQYDKWSPAARGPRTTLALLPFRAEAGRFLTEASLDVIEQQRLQLDELGALLQSRGFVTKGGRLRRARLCEMVLAYSRGRYEHPELDALLSCEASVAKLLAPLWCERVCLHPVIAHVLASALREQCEFKQLALLESERKIRLRELRDALASSPTASAAARATGVCVTTAAIHARAAGKVLSERPKKLKPYVRDLVMDLLVSGAEVADTAALTGLSLVSVYRALASNPGLREARADSKRAKEVAARQASWLDVIQRSPGLCVRQLRLKAPALYAYLYRHCREWLSEVTPRMRERRKPSPSRRRAPLGADLALARRLNGAAQVNAMELPARKTRTALLAEAGRPHDVPSPGSMASMVLQDNSESLRCFVYRRLSAAAARLYNEGLDLAPWRVERACGLRTSVITKSGVRTEMVIADTKAAALRRFQA